ncbi:MAG: GNAT family N-acetyltransferase [Rhodobacteraceae bacterium]|nr:GNAT family N-acetyltransferase [Paracoccaceae bacterium]
MIPEVETERLILRGMVREDFPKLAAIWQEPEVVRFIGGKPRPVNESWAVFLRIAGGWAIEGFGQWGIFRKSDGAFLGQTGFFNAMRGLGPDFDDAPEAGWVLTTQVHGQGYGREAVTAAHRWFDAQAFGGRSRAMIEVGHAASFAVAEHLGYRPLRETEDLGDRVMLLARNIAH